MDAKLAVLDKQMEAEATRTGWPDLVVGLGIAALNIDTAHEVWTAARKEGAAVEGCAPWNCSPESWH